MLTRKKVIAVIVLVAGCWLVPRAADAVMGNSAIRFYGRVVNEHGNPVEGAEIKAEVRANPRLFVPCFWGPGQDRKTISTTSDAGGRFSIEARGTAMEIQTIRRRDRSDPMSTWYPSEKERGYFYYSCFSPVPGHDHFFVPEKDRPVVFHLPAPPPPRPVVKLPWGVDRK